MITLHEPSDVEKAAAQLLERYPEQTTFVFKGELGVGKTTLIKAICERKGVKDVMSSPTFALINEYQGEGGLIIYHLDLYRLRSEEEALDIGIEELLDDSASMTLIEWPEIIENLLPPDSVEVEIFHQKDNIRKVVIR